MAHRIGTLSFGLGVRSDLRADREPSLGSYTAGPEAQPYQLINSRKAKGHWYKSRLYQLHTLWLKDRQVLRVEGKRHAEHPLDGARLQ